MDDIATFDSGGGQKVGELGHRLEAAGKKGAIFRGLMGVTGGIRWASLGAFLEANTRSPDLSAQKA